MPKPVGILSFFASLYRDGFRNMTWGKPMDRKKITPEEIEQEEHKY
ncbi:MAG: hypothetical protein IJT74_09730 [Bacteroidales bacterium]|nr:hypothetical protein [Bacteroidales bacterium]